VPLQAKTSRSLARNCRHPVSQTLFASFMQAHCRSLAPTRRTFASGGHSHCPVLSRLVDVRGASKVPSSLRLSSSMSRHVWKMRANFDRYPASGPALLYPKSWGERDDEKKGDRHHLEHNATANPHARETRMWQDFHIGIESTPNRYATCDY
jgi:hypothetical protein